MGANVASNPGKRRYATMNPPISLRFPGLLAVQVSAAYRISVVGRTSLSAEPGRAFAKLEGDVGGSAGTDACPVEGIQFLGTALV